MRGTARGALHRGWVEVRHALDGTDAAIIVECLRGEAAAIKAYDHAVRRAHIEAIPVVLSLVLEHHAAIQDARAVLGAALARAQRP